MSATAISLSTVLPQSSQLKINFDFQYTEGTELVVDLSTTAARIVFESYINSSTLAALAEYSVTGFDTVTVRSGGTYYSVCGEDADESCQTTTYVVIDTSGITSSSFRTVDSISGTWSYEDLYVQHTVTFNSNGGSSVSSQSIYNGETVTEPTDPTKSGFVFGDWYSDSELTTLWDFDTDTVSADMTLYAKWYTPAAGKLKNWAESIEARVTDVESDKVNANTAITGATKAKITYDSKGLVTGGADLARADIPTTVLYPPTNTQDANYTLVLADDGKLILAGHATNAVKVTIPLNSSVAFPTNTEIAIYKNGAGDVTIGTASGATLRGSAYTTTFEINDSVSIKKVGTDEWIMTGDFSEVV